MFFFLFYMFVWLSKDAALLKRYSTPFVLPTVEALTILRNVSLYVLLSSTDTRAYSYPGICFKIGIRAHPWYSVLMYVVACLK